MSIRIERSSLDQVRKRFEINKKKREEKQRDYDLEQRVKELREEVSYLPFAEGVISWIITCTNLLLFRKRN